MRSSSGSCISDCVRRQKSRGDGLLSALGYAALAVVIGGALGLLRGAAALAVHPAALLLPFVVAAGALAASRHFAPFPKFLQISSSRQLVVGLGMLLTTILLVLASESILIFDWPSAAGMVAGTGTGMALLGAWIERDASVAGMKLAVLLLYLSVGLVALSTLFTLLPPSAFWVVSASLPAWQARRLVMRGELGASARLFSAATRMFVGVLALALFLSAILLYR